ncbi:MAG: hypothetical protein WAM14_13760 [Candidatus Nitrosopolaris sp.]
MSASNRELPKEAEAQHRKAAEEAAEAQRREEQRKTYHRSKSSDKSYHKHREERAASRKWPSSSLEPIYKLRRCTRSQGHTARVRVIPVLEVVFFVDCHSTIDMLIGSKKCLKSLKLCLKNVPH